jgi:hypothetical protein
MQDSIFKKHKKSKKWRKNGTKKEQGEDYFDGTRLLGITNKGRRTEILFIIPLQN